MAKILVLDAAGKAVREIETDLFESPARFDIVQKIAETEKMNALRAHPYAPFYLAGQQTSASGSARHKRHSWKSDRGMGLARIPKKRMSDKGTRFVWVGAVIPGTRGGRRAHPPKIKRKLKKINRKEFMLALKSALAMVADAELVKKKYKTLAGRKLGIKLPLVVEGGLLALKTGEFIAALQKILGDSAGVGIQKRKVRAGRGKTRGRKYKKSAGALFVVAEKEAGRKIQGVDVAKAGEVSVSDLASNGARLVVFTEQAVKELEARIK